MNFDRFGIDQSDRFWSIEVKTPCWDDAVFYGVALVGFLFLVSFLLVRSGALTTNCVARRLEREVAVWVCDFAFTGS